MDNETLNLDVLQLEGLKVSPEASTPAFVFLLLIYIFIVVSNNGLMILITIESSHHETMYLLFCNMSINDVSGATAVIPRMPSDVLVPRGERCIRYADCAHFHGGISHTGIVIMAYDRYVAICHPLRYAAIMTNNTVVALPQT